LSEAAGSAVDRGTAEPPGADLEVSVIVPTLRRPDVLTGCLEALARQEHPPAAILVAHRSFDDQTKAVFEDPRFQALPIRPVEVAEPGLIAAYNTALGMADGDIVAITDDDTKPVPDWLSRITATFAGDQRIAAVGGRDWIWRGGRWVDEESSEEVGLIQGFGRVIGNHHMGIGPARDVDVLKGANMSFRVDALRDLRFDERLRGEATQTHTELSVCLPLRARGARIVYDPEIRVDHFPAERPGGERRERLSFRSMADTVHNETLTVLEFLPPRGRLMFAGWSVLIGARGAPGLAQMVRLALRGERPPLAKLGATLYGRWLGWRTYRRGGRPG
jgi:cellulose synthase/poly-beta-1,6-N-acetylglucosamine synthase-like glycosyltransferase